MPYPVPISPQNLFASPTEIILAANTTLPATARFLVQAYQTGAGYTLTIPARQTHQIVNAGAYSMSVTGTGTGTLSLQVAGILIFSWDVVSQTHKVTQNSITVDSAMSTVSTNPVQNKVVQAAIDALGGGGGGDAIVTNIAALRALATSPTTVIVKGHTAAWDGGGGVFDLLLASGGTPGDIGSGGHDDDGAHVVCTTTTSVYGRRETDYTPQMFGAVAYASETAAAAGTSQLTKMQRWVDFIQYPPGFSGWAYRDSGANTYLPIRGVAPDGFYRCDAPLHIDISGTAPLQSGGVPGEIEFIGKVWTPKTVTTQAIVVDCGRRSGLPRMILRAVKQKETTNRVMWNADPWPDLWRDAAAYRAWASTISVYAGECITQVLGSGATALYEVTVSGTTTTTAPTDTSGSTFANGSATLKYLGTIKNTSGRSCHDMIARCRDIGVHVNTALDWQGLEAFTEGYTVGLGLWPRNDTTASVGLSRFDGQHYGCKIGVLIAHWIVDASVADQAAMLALTGLPVGFVVRRGDDASNDWIFNGPVGGEATLANWATTTRNASSNWNNENQLLGGVNYYAYGTGNFIDTSKAIYGVVSTSFEPTSSADAPSHNIHHGLAVEHASKTLFGEMVNVLFEYGIENEMRARNDQENYPVAHFLMHASNTNEPTRNVVHTPRAGRFVSDKTWRKDTSNGRGNRIQQVGPDHRFTKEYICKSFFHDWVFSGDDRIYAKDTSFWQPNTSSKFTNWVTAWGGSPALSGPHFHADDLSFDISLGRSPVVIVDLPEDHGGRATIEIEALLSPNSASVFRTYIAIYDPISGAIANFSSRPRIPLGAMPGLQFSATGVHANTPMYWNQSDQNMPTFISPEAWVRKLLIGFQGTRMVGFRIAVHECRGATITSPAQAYHKHSGHVVVSAPERGIYRAPCRLMLTDQTGTNKWLRLNKVESTTDWWAVTDAVADIVTPLQGQWGSASAGTEVQEYNGSTWDSLATGVSTIEPADWVAEP
jgi:hypothetical protein